MNSDIGLVVRSGIRAANRVFHNVEDFQQAFCHRVKRQFPDVGVRAEYPVIDSSADVLLTVDSSTAAVELLYPTEPFYASTDIEAFAFDTDAVSEARTKRIDAVNRVQQFIDTGVCDYGYVVVLTNNPALWENEPDESDVVWETYEYEYPGKPIGNGEFRYCLLEVEPAITEAE